MGPRFLKVKQPKVIYNIGIRTIMVSILLFYESSMENNIHLMVSNLPYLSVDEKCLIRDNCC